MVFTAASFIYLFLPVTLIIYALLPGLKYRNGFLLFASMFFYAFGQPAAFPVMLFSILVNYVSGRLMAKKHKKFFLALSVTVNLGLLFVYKYLGYALSLAGIASPTLSEEISVVGISFFTFQAMSYVIDCYRRETLINKNIFDIALYISFFPQLVAGPVVRYGDFRKQISDRTHTAAKTARGIKRFSIGFGKKLITANTAALIADTVFSCETDSLSPFAAWTGAICYAVQIYYDFSGYSDMALGLGKIFGFDLPENFNYPYFSSSITDFWRRWHISLSSWFRDYLYIPLGGNRKGRVRTVLNKWMVFICTGIWHGANLTFLLWGMIHGAALSFEALLKNKKENAFTAFLHRIITLLIIILSFVIFRAENISQGLSYIKNMFVPGGDISADAKIIMLLNPYSVTVMIIGIIFSFPVSKALSRKIPEEASYFFAFAVFVLSLLSLSEGGYNPFIYFRF